MTPCLRPAVHYLFKLGLSGTIVLQPEMDQGFSIMDFDGVEGAHDTLIRLDCVRLMLFSTDTVGHVAMRHRVFISDSYWTCLKTCFVHTDLKHGSESVVNLFLFL